MLNIGGVRTPAWFMQDMFGTGTAQQGRPRFQSSPQLRRAERATSSALREACQAHTETMEIHPCCNETIFTMDSNAQHYADM